MMSKVATRFCNFLIPIFLVFSLSTSVSVAASSIKEQSPSNSWTTSCESALLGLKTRAGESLKQDGRSLNVLVIDGGHPDIEHPDFFDSNGNTIIQSVESIEFAGGSEHPLFWEPEKSDQASSVKVAGWRERLTSWWFARVGNGELEEKVKKHTSVFKLLTTTLPVASMASAGLAYLVQHDPHFFTNAVNFYSAHWSQMLYVPVARWIFFSLPYLASPKTYFLRKDQIHPTHVAGTIARGYDTFRDHLKIHTMDMREVHGGVPNDPIYSPPESNESLLARLRKNLEAIIQKIDAQRAMAGSGRRSPLRPHSFEEEAKKFLLQFYLENEAYTDGLIAYIRTHKIRAVNMSYGIQRLDAVRAIARGVEKEFGINPSPSTELGKKVMDIHKMYFKKLVKNCPETAFFIAAGNDGESIHDGNSVFENISGPNVLSVHRQTSRFSFHRFLVLDYWVKSVLRIS